MSRFKKLPRRTLNALPKHNVKDLPDAHNSKVYDTGIKRVRGRANQKRRLELWEEDPHCAMCRKVVAYPQGFELDHIVPLSNGGTDDKANWQILCVWWEGGQKAGCHAIKTAYEQAGR